MPHEVRPLKRLARLKATKAITGERETRSSSAPGMKRERPAPRAPLGRPPPTDATNQPAAQPGSVDAARQQQVGEDGEEEDGADRREEGHARHSAACGRAKSAVLSTT